MKKSQLKQIIKSTIREILAEESASEKLLNMKIKNPETGDDIKLKSALAYDKSSQVYKVAKSTHDKAMQVIKKDSAQGDQETPSNEPTPKTEPRKEPEQVGKLRKDMSDDEKQQAAEEEFEDTFDDTNLGAEDHAEFSEKLIGLAKDAGWPSGEGDYYVRGDMVEKFIEENPEFIRKHIGDEYADELENGEEGEENLSTKDAIEMGIETAITNAFQQGIAQQELGRMGIQESSKPRLNFKKSELKSIIREEIQNFINEAFSNWEVKFVRSIKNKNVGDVKKGHVEVVKARGTSEAIKKACKNAGCEGAWMHVDVEVTKK